MGYTSFTVKAPFSPALFVEFRKRLTEELMAKINDIVATHAMNFGADGDENATSDDSNKSNEDSTLIDNHNEFSESPPDQAIKDQKEQKCDSQTEFNNHIREESVNNKGQLLMDATVAPQNITYPTDLKLLNAEREKAEQIIDGIFDRSKHSFKKPKTYRIKARKDFLNVSKKKRKSRNAIRTAVGKQIRYIRRDLKHIDRLLATYANNPLRKKNRKCLETIRKIYEQQNYMYVNRIHTVEDRIVNLMSAQLFEEKKEKVEFGSKIQASLVNGFVFIDHISWDAFNESTCLVDSVERYKKKFGFYPYEVLADQIYCTRQNRKELKTRNIKLVAKPPGSSIGKGSEKSCKTGRTQSNRR